MPVKLNVSASIGPEPVSVFWGPFLFRRNGSASKQNRGWFVGAILGNNYFPEQPIAFSVQSLGSVSGRSTKFVVPWRVAAEGEGIRA